MTTMTMIESNILNEYGVYRKFSNKKKKILLKMIVIRCDGDDDDSNSRNYRR